MGAPTNAAYVKKVLANPEPSTHDPRCLRDLQNRRCDCVAARHPRENLFGQIAIRFGKNVFFYGPFVFFERAFNPVHVLAVSIGHGGYNSVIATSLPAKE